MSALDSMELVAKGKVREVYADGNELVMVTSDRISAFDVIMSTPIPDKGRVLTQTSVFWFGETADICPNHLLSADDVPEEARGRGMRVRRLEMFPVECVVRGYLAGSGWKDYQRDGAVCGVALPPGLRESDKLPEPIFTPATKADVGDHDENVDFERAARIVGNRALLAELQRISIALYEQAAAHLAERGILLADTKFEFGSHPGCEVVLGDEALTPDSSRLWPADTYEPGRAQRSFDKQFVRDWLETLDWNKRAPGPELPDDVVAATRERYLEAHRRITGAELRR